jgi:MFS family permease
MATTRGRRRALSGSDWHRLALLGLPTFGLALSITAVSTYLPTVARRFTGSTTVIGVVIGGEGLAAILLPIVVGAWSDRLKTGWGGRLPFVAAGAPVAAAALVAMGLVGSMGALALAVAVFFVGYFIAYEPYRAFYPDLVDDEVAGRAQSTQAISRGAGTGVALLGGGLLLAQGQAAPFVAASVLLSGTVGVFVWRVARSGAPDQDRTGESVRDTIAQMAHLLVHERPLRAFFFANALWELSLGALKTFVVLWLTRGLGIGLGAAALIVGATAAIVLLGAGFAGKLADRLGRRRVMRWAVVCFGAPMVVPLLSTSRPLLIAAVPFIAVGGGVLMSLPYALLQPMMPDRHHGAMTGYYSVSRGLGVALGPLLGGVAVSVGAGVLASTQGYAAVWAVCGASALASLPLLGRVSSSEHRCATGAPGGST